MSVRASQPIVGGIYPLGSGRDETLQNGSAISSDFFNTRDLGDPGFPEFGLVGPGSQAWFLGYAVRVAAAALPAEPLLLELRVSGSFDTTTPFILGTIETIVLPVYEFLSREYFGRVRLEHPVGTATLFNSTGLDLTVSFQYWGKTF